MQRLLERASWDTFAVMGGGVGLLGRQLLAECVDAGVPVGWCAADAVYGRDSTLRRHCERHDVPSQTHMIRSRSTAAVSGIVSGADDSAHVRAVYDDPNGVNGTDG